MSLITSTHRPLAACVTLWVSVSFGVLKRRNLLRLPFDQLYEYICTFALEVEFIWKARWTITKVLYLLTRYLQFIVVGSLLHESELELGLASSFTMLIERQVAH
jgi:hypothetical protein